MILRFSLLISAVSLLWIGGGVLNSQDTNKAQLKTSVGTQKRGNVERTNGIVEALEPGVAKQLAMGLLNQSRSTLFEAVLASTQADLKFATLGTAPKAESEPNFSDTLAQLSPYSTAQLGPAAQILRLGGDAVLTYRAAGHDGELRREILSGRDPTSKSFGRVNYRWLTFGIKSFPFGDRPGIVAFFESSSQPTCEACLNIASEFQRIGTAAEVEVEIRTDVWFASQFYPVLFRFAPENRNTYRNSLGQPTAPKLDIYYRQPHMECRLAASIRKCSGYGVYEELP